VDNTQWCSEGTLRLGAKDIFALPPTKTAQFEVKNMGKSTKEAVTARLLFVTSVIF